MEVLGRIYQRSAIFVTSAVVLVIVSLAPLFIYLPIDPPNAKKEGKESEEDDGEAGETPVREVGRNLCRSMSRT